MDIVMQSVVVAMLILHVKSCSENEFRVQDSVCCSYCEEDWYVEVNCSKTDKGFTGVTCRPCSTCPDGTKMIAPCTKFSNTKCKEESVIPIERSVVLEKGVTTSTALYTAAPVILLMIVATVTYKWCTRRRVSRDSAEEPLKLMP